MRTEKFIIIVIVFLTTVFGLTAEEKSGVDGGIAWLANHQEPDGHWDSLKYGASKKSDIEATSLALLALLGPGYSEKVGEYKGNVKRAVAWLISKQNESGKTIDASDAVVPIEEAWGATLAVLALSESAALANIETTRAAAQKGVSQLIEDFPFKNSRAADGSIIYGIDENADTATIGWVVMALKSAKIAGLRAPRGAFDALIHYLDSVEHKLGTDSKNELAASEYRYSIKERIADGHPSYRINAIASLSRQFLGWKRDDLALTVEHFIDQSGLPVWNKDAENVDLYYWYAATLCAFQQGNVFNIVEPSRNGIWRSWNEPKNKALLDNQCHDGDDRGSWNAQGFASRKWGRVGQTALACLCMEIYMR